MNTNNYTRNNSTSSDTPQLAAANFIPPLSSTAYGYDQGTLTSYADVNDPGMMYADPGATAKRGNLTAVTQYVDSTTGSVTHATTYDVFGNAITASVDCCQMKSYNYSGTYHHAYPTSLTRGSNPTFTSSTTYDFQTGLVGSATDENNQTTNISYNGDSLRVHHIAYPDGGAVYFNYADGLIADAAGRLHYFTNTSTLINGSTYAENYRFYDGRGALTQTFDNYANSNWSTVDIEYDVMGRAYRTSNPYYCGGYGWVGINPPELWTVSTFDNLGRVVQVDMPSGDTQNLTTHAFTNYNGRTVTITDQAGKQRKQIRDGLGRLDEVDEPDESGNLGTAAPKTLYEYDALDNLVKIEQGTQIRRFKYDGLGRLKFELQPEQTAHYDDSGVWNSAGGAWSRYYVYNSYSFLTEVHDANNVVTSMTPDGLNRVHQISYSDGKTPTVTYTYDESRGSSYYNQDRLTSITTTAITGGAPQTVQEYDYDQMGRVSSQRQKIGSATYTMNYTYNLAGELLSESYPSPSSRMVKYVYNEAGQLSQVTDQNNVPYDNGITYAPHGGLTGETFGNGAVRNLAYNNSLQPKQVKLTLGGTEQQRYDYLYGTVNTSDGSVDQTKNNGQVGRIDGFINGQKQWDQRFSYDQLGRISQVGEYQQGNTSQQTYQAHYDYDRWGNHFQYQQNSNINYTPVQTTDISSATNRFTSGVTYDNAGNITSDQKFRGMDYTYDANNRQLTATTTGTTFTQTSVYDGAGQRVQTSSPTGVTRQMVYDQFGQSIVELSNGSIERENIYRGGELLATQEYAVPSRTNVALSSQGATASAGSFFSGFAPSGAINGDRKGLGVGQNGYWSSSSNSLPNWIEVDFSGEKSISEIDVFSVQDSYSNPVEPTQSQTFTNYGLVNFKVQYWDQTISDWRDVPGGDITGNSLVWRQLTFSPVTTSKIKVTTTATVDGYSRMTELEAWEQSYPQQVSWTNMISTQPSGNTLAKTGSTGWNGGGNSTEQITTGNGYVEFTVDNNNTDRLCGLVHTDTTPSYTDTDFALYAQGGGNLYAYEQGVNVQSLGQYNAGDRLRVAIEDGVVKYSRNGSVLYSHNVTVTYPLKADASLYQVGATVSNVVLSSSTAPSIPLKYVMNDAQGSARVVMAGNQIVARHDFMPFGEEIAVNVGQRINEPTYGKTDTNRQKYALTGRDDSTGLDHTPWRKYESKSGRWTSPDPYNGSMSLSNPQSLNRYAYVRNDPVNFVDPSGLFRLAPHPPSSDTGMSELYWRYLFWSPDVGGGDPFGPPEGPPKRPDLPDWLRDFYKKHRGQIDRCINKIFGELADGTPDIAATIMERQTMRNAPELDTSVDQFHLNQYSGHEGTQGTYSLAGNLGYGTVYIAKELYGRISLDEKQRTYFHELGNILSERISGNSRTYGDPKGILFGGYSDKDTGARLEKCIFKAIPKPQ